MGRSRRPRAPRALSGHELLRDFADGRFEAGLPRDERPLIGGREPLSESSERLVQIAALASVGAPMVLWVDQLADESATEVDLDGVAEVLLAIAPIVGSSRIAAAAEGALAAARLVEDDETS
jgi:hypothetical protein